MARCHIDVGIQWSVPGGGGHCLGHGNPVSAVMVDTGALWPYLGLVNPTKERKKQVKPYPVHTPCMIIAYHVPVC